MGFVLATGATAPEFSLPGSDGKIHTFAGNLGVKGSRGTVIFFTCNHCPYVVGSEDRMVALYKKLENTGVNMVAIHSNETADHPTDSWPAVLDRMRTMDLPWLALQDESQLVARAFGAERTPHYFLFDASGCLYYSGRMDNSPRDVAKAQTRELADALEDMLAGRPARLDRTDAIGCNIKWWGKDKHWMPAEACDLDFLHQRETGKNPA